MLKLCVFVFVAACGAKSAPPSSEPAPPAPPPEQGSAEPTAVEPTGPMCGTRGVQPCPANMFCNYAPSAGCGETDKPGFCMVTPIACSNNEFKPLCGCDGKTYSHACSAAISKVGIRHEGPCS